MLNDELHILHAALVLLHIKEGRLVAVTLVPTRAHLHHFRLRFLSRSLAAEYFDADVLELVTDVSVACCITSPR